MTLEDHLSNKTFPKRVLALDGGGIRGALTLGYLQRIEDILRKQHGNDNSFRLSHYFDLIGGTSTGSIIAGCLALGMKVSDITDLYMDLGLKIFARKYKWWKIFEIDDLLNASYNEKPLEQELEKAFGDIKLGDTERIKTGLCIIAKRADTNSLWAFTNHPDGKYFNDARNMNRDILLSKAIRASSAAPTYFLPQIIDVGAGINNEAAFIDGGVSMANNPALQCLMVATLQGYPFRWQWGDDKLLLVSVGTGMSKWKKIPQNIRKNNLLNWASQLPDMFMQDASWHNQLILQWISSSRTASLIDREIGTLEKDLIGQAEKAKGLISYLRYNLWLDAETLEPLMGKHYEQREIDRLIEMSNAANREILFEIGTKAAVKQVDENDFPERFKLI